jgi:hypothetical protein
MAVNDETTWTSIEAIIAFIKLRDKCLGIFCLRLRDATSSVTNHIVPLSNLVPSSRIYCFLGSNAVWSEAVHHLCSCVV